MSIPAAPSDLCQVIPDILGCDLLDVILFAPVLSEGSTGVMSATCSEHGVIRRIVLTVERGSIHDTAHACGFDAVQHHRAHHHGCGCERGRIDAPIYGERMGL